MTEQEKERIVFELSGEELRRFYRLADARYTGMEKAQIARDALRVAYTNFFGHETVLSTEP